MIKNDHTKLTKQIQCNGCGAIVSTPVPKNTVIRAWVECPECIEKKGTAQKRFMAGWTDGEVRS